MIQDNDLRFDIDSERYYLTQNYVLEKLGTDLKMVAYDELDARQSTLPQRTIEYACDKLWDFIQDNAVNPRSSRYATTKFKDMHNAIKRALGYELLDFIQYGEDEEHPISKRAVKTLNGAGLFHIIVRDIPEVGNW